MSRRKPLQRSPMDVHGPEATPVAKLGPEIKAKIGQQLRLMYSEVVNQGVPERFVEILRGLDDPTNEGSKNDLS